MSRRAQLRRSWSTSWRGAPRQWRSTRRRRAVRDTVTHAPATWATGTPTVADDRSASKVGHAGDKGANGVRVEAALASKHAWPTGPGGTRDQRSDHIASNPPNRTVSIGFRSLWPILRFIS
jgi:hypothetical protein